MRDTVCDALWGFVRSGLYPTGMEDFSTYEVAAWDEAAVRKQVYGFRRWLRSLRTEAVAEMDLCAIQKELGSVVPVLLATCAEIAAIQEDRGDLGSARNAADALARSCDLTHREARDLVDTNFVLQSGNGTALEKFRQGEIGLARAREVAKGVAIHPDAEELLCETAENGSSQDVRRLRFELRHRSPAAEERVSRRQAALRSCRRWTDDEGMWNLHARLTPAEGAEMVRVLTPYRQLAFNARKAAGSPMEGPLIAADGIMAMVRKHRDHLQECGNDATASSAHFRTDNEADSPSRSSRDGVGEIQLLVSVEALRRGYAHQGEYCEIPGIGSVSVTEAKRLLGDRPYRLLVHSGRDVRSITGVGRTIPQSLRRAMEFRDPTCTVLGCEAKEFLEFDHILPFSRGGPTTYENLRRLCHHHHRLISEFGFTLEPYYEAGLGTAFTQGSAAERTSVEECPEWPKHHIPDGAQRCVQWILKPPQEDTA